MIQLKNTSDRRLEFHRLEFLMLTLDFVTDQYCGIGDEHGSLTESCPPSYLKFSMLSSHFMQLKRDAPLPNMENVNQFLNTNVLHFTDKMTGQHISMFIPHFILLAQYKM